MAIKFPTITLREPGLPLVLWNPMASKQPGFEPSGVFTRDSLPNLIQSLREELCSGKLHLRSGAFRAFIAFNEGQIALARFGTQVDAIALERIIALEAGVYEFEPGEVKSSAMIAQDSEAFSNVLRTQKQTQEFGPISGSSVPMKLDAESVDSGSINLMRIHWQIMKNTDGQRTFDEIAAMIGLNHNALERPMRDLLNAGLVTMRHTTLTQTPAPSQPSVRVTHPDTMVPAPAAPTAPKTPSIIEQVAAIKQVVVPEPKLGNQDFGIKIGIPEPKLDPVQSRASHDAQMRVSQDAQMRVSHDQDFGIKPVVPEPKLGSQDFGIKTTSPEPKPERHETRSTSTSTDTRSGKSTSSRSIALERLSAIRDTFSGRSTISEARHTAPETPVSTEPAPLQAMQVSGPINPGFFNDLRPRLASLIGPMASFVLEDAADMAGGTLHTLRAEQLEAFLRAVVAEVPPAKHAQLRELVRPLLKRYGLRPTKENG